MTDGRVLGTASRKGAPVLYWLALTRGADGHRTGHILDQTRRHSSKILPQIDDGLHILPVSARIRPETPNEGSRQALMGLPEAPCSSGAFRRLQAPLRGDDCGVRCRRFSLELLSLPGLER